MSDSKINNDKVEEQHLVQKDLMNKFLKSNDMSAFRKMGNVGIAPKEKKNFFMSDISHLKINSKFQRYHSSNNNNWLQSINTNTDNSNIQNYQLNRYKGFTGDESNEKRGKGNYKWASQKFVRMKINWAKRKGIPYQDFQIPKVESLKDKKHSTEINGLNLPVLRSNTNTSQAHINMISKLPLI